ncbi:MAG: hypothetical protein LBK92_00620 [Endomicrobium sp.]|jgi:hypothetical protein|nr:hypothetical protein [Endomicrobium sp.]
MILYSNLTSVKVDGAPMKSAATLRLTSDIFIGSISSESVKEDIVDSFKTNDLSEKQKVFIECLFKEANENSFIVQICGTKQ